MFRKKRHPNGNSPFTIDPEEAMGTEIIVGCAIIGVAIVIAGWFFSRRPSQPKQVMMNGMIMESPDSPAGYPVVPSNIPVDSDTPLKKGMTVLSFSQGRWWRAEIVAIEPDEYVKIHFPGWDPKWDISIHRDELQVDNDAPQLPGLRGSR